MSLMWNEADRWLARTQREQNAGWAKHDRKAGCSLPCDATKLPPVDADALWRKAVGTVEHEDACFCVECLSRPRLPEVR